jgi:hypothetical protein
MQRRTSFAWAATVLAILTLCHSAGGQLVERPLISGRRAMVRSDQPLASMAGMRILM